MGVKVKEKTLTAADKETLRLAKQLKLIDDDLFNKAAENRNFCQEILRTIYGDPGLEVIENTAQAKLKNLQGRSVVYDAKCKLSDGTLVDIEVQKENNDDFKRRVRYNGSVLTANATLKGTDFRDVPNVCVIFISKFDPFKRNKTVYHVVKVVKETGEEVNDGCEEIYVNAKVDDKSEIAELMKIFSDDDTYDYKKFPEVSNFKSIYKKGSEGDKNMSEIAAKIRKIGREEGREEERLISIRSLMDSVGWTASQAMDALKINEKDRVVYLEELKKPL